MSDPFLAEIRMFPFGFAPRGWALCNGQIMPIAQNTALFALINTYYGGNGTSNFALPNLQGTAPMHSGNGNGLSQRSIGETGGEPNVTLIDSETPTHSHSLMCSTSVADGPSPGNAAIARVSGATPYLPPAGAPMVPMAAAAVQPFPGKNLPHNNMQPYLTLSFCIALQGVFPPRS